MGVFTMRKSSHTFAPSYASNPGALTLVVDHMPARRNAGETFRWETKDGWVLQIKEDDLSVTIVLPERYAGITFKPGVKRYSEYIDTAIKHWDKSASFWEANVNWPVERELLEKARKAALNALPETENPVDANGNPVEPPAPPGETTSNLLMWVGIGVAGLVAIGAVSWAVLRKSST